MFQCPVQTAPQNSIQQWMTPVNQGSCTSRSTAVERECSRPGRLWSDTAKELWAAGSCWRGKIGFPEGEGSWWVEHLTFG